MNIRRITVLDLLDKYDGTTEALEHAATPSELLTVYGMLHLASAQREKAFTRAELVNRIKELEEMK